MSKKYIRLDRPIKDYTAAELAPIVGGLQKSELVRTIILNEKEYISVDYDRSLRSFWYSTVKPTLDKLGRLDKSDATEKGLTNWDSKLSLYMAELVRMGEVTYKQLRIVDTSRQRSTPEESYKSADAGTYGYQVTAAPYPNIIISTEKDTVYSIIANIATFFGCSAISGKGQNSLAAMEDLLRNMDAASDDPAAPIYILTMTDYDPAGYYIAETFRRQVMDLRGNLGIRRAVRIERIGIFPHQLTPDEVTQNCYTPKPAGLDKWLRATGGIDAQAKGLELDALTPDRIRRLFVDALRKFVDVEQYSEFIRRAYLQKMALDMMRDKVSAIVSDVAADALDSIDLKDIDLLEVAATGARYIPVEHLCRTSQAHEIREKVLSYFVN